MSIIVVALVLATLTLSQASPLQLTIIDLGTLGGRSSAAFDINDHGQIVGTSSTASGETHAFLWDKGVMIDLGTLPGHGFSEPFIINNQGQIVGLSAQDGGLAGVHAFLWERGVMTDLATLCETPCFAGIIVLINERGQITGSGLTVSGEEHAYFWEKGVMTDIGPLPGFSFALPLDINERGQIVGVSLVDPRTAEDPSLSRGFLWEKGVTTDLGTLGGARTFATAINERGQIVGDSQTGSETHAFLWQNGLMTDLGTLPGHDNSFARDINERGQIVGSSSRPAQIPLTFDSSPVLWENGVITDLGTIRGARSAAVDINERGQIIVQSLLVIPGIPGVTRLFRGFLWEKGVMTDLGTLPSYTSSTPHSINERGEIVGRTFGLTPEGIAFSSAVLWRKAPPPQQT